MADRNDFDRERYGNRETEREHDRARGDWNREGNFGDRGAGRGDWARESEWSGRHAGRGGDFERERGFGGERGYSERGFGGYGGERSGRPYAGAGEWGNREPDWERESSSGNEQRYTGVSDRDRENWREAGGNTRYDWGGESEREARFGSERGSAGTGTFGGSSRSGYGGGYGGGSYAGGMGTYGESGRHAGRGPKGYQRSDDRIREDVCEYLTHHPEIDASEVEVQVKNGEVTLTGTVDRREMKRVAEEAAENVSGAKDVHNQLKVQQQGAFGGQGPSLNDRQQGRQGQPSQQTQHKS
jgi:hypothetical protein